MGMFDSFLGRKSPYTEKQQAGLDISRRIKQGRADRLVAADKAKAKEAAKQARLARMEKGLTSPKGSLKLPPAPKLPDTSKQQVQRMKGKQAMDLAKFKSTEKSLAEKRDLTRAQLGAERGGGSNQTGNYQYVEGRTGKPGSFNKNTGEWKALEEGTKATGGNKYEGMNHTISEVLDMEEKNPKELRAYMDWLKKNKPDKYLEAASGYKKFHNPAPADPEEDTTQQIQPGADIYQNSSGKYTNM